MSARSVRPRLRAMLMAGIEPAWLRRHPRRDYVRMVTLSCPPWVNRQWLCEIEQEARRRTAVTGVKHVVDHMIPVCHDLVCGLTVPWNLEVITEAENAKKGNGLHHAFQMEMFDQPEQMELFK